MKKTLKYTLAASTLVLISACGGGGGGGGTSATLAPFTSWASLQPNTTVNLDGLTQTGTYSYDLTNRLVTARTISASTTGSTYSTSFDSSLRATASTISPAGGNSVSWSRANDTYGVLIINNDIDALISADGSKYAFAADPYDFGWDYQSFGVWVTGAGTGSGTYGSMSAGAVTPGASIPTSGLSSYFGSTGGRYIDSAGRDYFTSSSMRADVNFTNRTVSFATTGTQQTRDLLNVSNNSNLNMTGSLTYSSASNAITGNVSTVGGLAGTVNARFYGPLGQEIGGTFSAESGGIEGYAGAFGGKR